MTTRGTYGSEIIQQKTYMFGIDSGAANAYLVTMLFGFAPLVPGSTAVFVAANSNTGPSTINLVGLYTASASAGVFAIKKQVSVDLGANDILAGQVVELVYDGTNFQFAQAAIGPTPPNLLSSSIGIVIDGGGSTPLGGQKGFIQVPFNCTITGWTMVADQTGSAQITVSKGTYGAFPTLTSIDASLPPNLSSAQKNTSTTLTGWTTTINAGDMLGFNLDSASTVTRITLQLLVTKS